MTASNFTAYLSDQFGRAGVRADRHVVARILKSIAIVSAMVCALVFANLTSKKQSAWVASQTANAWSTQATSASKTSIDAFISQWRVTQATAGDAATLRWNTSDVATASASLLALDAAKSSGAKIQRINVSKRDGRVELSAEVSQ
jgi:hypothetical protein